LKFSKVYLAPLIDCENSTTFIRSYFSPFSLSVSFSLYLHMRAYIYVRCSCAHPLHPTVIRGLLTRRVAPAPARQSFTLKSNPTPLHASRCHAIPGVLSPLPPSTKEGFYRPIVTHRKSNITANCARKDEKSRRRRERYWRRSLTTLPLLAWRSSRIVPVYVYINRYIFAPHSYLRLSRRGGAVEAAKAAAAAVAATTARTRKRSPRFNRREATRWL